MKSKLILVGAGGHCLSVIDTIEQENKFEIIGILDNEKTTGEKILNYPILGNDNLIPTYNTDNIYFLITVIYDHYFYYFLRNNTPCKISLFALFFFKNVPETARRGGGRDQGAFLMRATLEFNLPEDQEEHRYALAGVDLVAAIRALDADLRTLEKHGIRGSSASAIRQRLAAILVDRDLSWILG